MNWKHWIHGLGSAFIGGGATAVTVIVIDPLTFNLQNGLEKVVTAFLVSAFVSACFYLKQSPLPPDSSDSSSPSTLLKVAALGFFLFGFQGCSTVQNIEASDILPFVRPAVSLACTGVLNLALDGQDRIEKANMVFAVAKAVRTLSSGTVPSPSDLASVIDLWMPDKSHWSKLSTTISGVYAGAFKQLQGNPLLAVQLLEQIAQGCEDSAGAITKGGQ